MNPRIVTLLICAGLMIAVAVWGITPAVMPSGKKRHTPS